MGGYDETGEYYTGEIVWLECNHNYFWQAKVKAVRIHGDEYMVPSAPVIFDTGTSLMYIPTDTLKKIMTKHLDGISYYISDGYYYATCGLSKYKTISFLIGTYWIDIHPAQYVMEDNNECYIAIGGSDDDSWLFGDTLFRSYYTVFDEENGLIGFAPRTGVSVNELIKAAEFPLTEL